MKGLSILFFAGDFNDALHRYREGRQQAYATHDEVAKLMIDLAQDSVPTTFYSFISPKTNITSPLPGVKIIDLGGKSYNDTRLLCRALEEDRSEAIIPHFPNLTMLKTVSRSARRGFPILASSFYRRAPRAWLDRMRLVRALNEFELVANHCRPATEHLAELGVNRGRLIPWDVPHRFDPSMTHPKPKSKPTLLYVGAISVAKGVGELIRAVSEVGSVDLHLAGQGEIEEMQALASSLGVTERVKFLGRTGNDDVFRMMREVGAIVIPSRAEFQEGLPLVMFEAVASHTPIICSNHPIFAKFMRDGENASVFKSGSSSDLARAIRELLGNSSQYERQSRAATTTWRDLGGTADWRSLIKYWYHEGANSPWIQSHLLNPPS